ncbi:MAG: phosphatidylserine decarboxylase [Clostridium sp.]|uniref:phosphatidylserine decarboxylase n=1 Tax=Clostridium sp. TaxID=1506 RepID=UPI0039EBFC5C
MIKYYNRKTKNYEIEKVAGEKYLNWIYNSPMGMNLLEKFLKKKLFSKFYGFYCNSRMSSYKIKKFVTNFDIDISHSEKSIKEFKSFNDFFSRKLVENSRPIDKNKNSLISPCDGRITAFNNINLDNLIQVKGITYKLSDFIKNDIIAKKYKNGSCIILRLCPTDYHRFHFLDSGICESTVKITGSYYSVNPIALNKINGVFCENKREWSIFHSDNFGDVLYVEVGATCVGSIIQTYTPNKKVFKGMEKGFFKFGGSTIVLFFENKKIIIDEDISEQSKLGFETKILIGEKIGAKFCK